MTDCLLIGHNDGDFLEYETMVRKMGTKTGAFRDLNLHYIELEGKPYRAMDVINHFHYANKPDPVRPFSNWEFLSPAILCLGSFLHSHGLTFDYVNSFNFEKEALKEKLMQKNLLAIGITTTFYVSVKPIIEIISFIRKYNQTAKIIIGGPFVATQLRQADQGTIQYLFKALGADVYVNSMEGENTLVQILHALKQGETLDGIPNLWYKVGNQYISTPVEEENNDLEEHPVNWTLFSNEAVGEFVSLRCSKSCPFDCSFCGFPERAGKYRYVSVEAIERDLNALQAKGTVQVLSFIDDTFNVPKERFKEILRMMIRNQYEFDWYFNFRCQFADEETVSLMKEAGCVGVFLGIESGSDHILQNMNKRAEVEQYRQGLYWLNQYGITSYASFIIGFPGETEETVEETVRFIEENKPTYYRTQLWYCDPLTPIWREKEKYGIKGGMFQWSHQTMTSEQACDQIERIFRTITNSIWLPQNSFEIFSLFYLQKKGMSVEQVNLFLRTFNQLVATKLGMAADQSELVNRLQEVCQF